MSENVCESEERGRRIVRVTLLGGVVNALLLVAKFVAGILGHSAAMIADAVHSLSDFVTDVIVVVFVKLSNKPADEDHAYGHGKVLPPVYVEPIRTHQLCHRERRGKLGKLSRLYTQRAQY